MRMGKSYWVTKIYTWQGQALLQNGCCQFQDDGFLSLIEIAHHFLYSIYILLKSINSVHIKQQSWSIQKEEYDINLHVR